MDNNSSKKQLVYNTIFLYLRTVILLIVGVFTSRLTLKALGVDNYGIINVVSGFVAMFSLINGSLTSTCQRFITYAIGSKDQGVNQVFNASVIIHLLLCLLIVLIAETFGIYFVSNKLNIPFEQKGAAIFLFQCSVASFVLSLINIPYNAIIVAYEKMKIFAYISLFEAFLKLTSVIVLLYIEYNKLVLYAIFSLVSSILLRLTFHLYCRKGFREDVRINFKIDSSRITEIFQFAGWSFIGNTATILSNQGVNIVLNLFCGVVLNAARGIASMLESVITSFVNNFTTALNPQITKAYASGEYNTLSNLVEMGMRISFYLMMLIAVPVIIVTPSILHIWFEEVPDFTVEFARLTLIISTVNAVANPYLTLILATGKIRKYQLVVGGITLLNLPGSYFLLKFGYSPISIYILNLSIVLLAFGIRLLFIKYTARIPIKSFIKAIYTKMLVTCLVGFTIVYCFHVLYGSINTVISLIFFLSIACSITAGTIYNLGLTSSEKKQINVHVKNKLASIYDR